VKSLFLQQDQNKSLFAYTILILLKYNMRERVKM